VEEAVKPLIKLCESQERKIRLGAVRALGQIGDVRAVEILSFATKDLDNEVRQYAIEALGKIKDPSAVEALEKAKRLLGDTK
jgi:HEAT repeat protein